MDQCYVGFSSDDHLGPLSYASPLEILLKD